MSKTRTQEVLELFNQIAFLAESEIDTPLGKEIQRLDRLCLDKFPAKLELEDLAKRILADPETREALRNIATMVAEKEREMKNGTEVKNEVAGAVNPKEDEMNKNDKDYQDLQAEGRALDLWCHGSEMGPRPDQDVPDFIIGYASMIFLTHGLGSQDAAQRCVDYLKEYRQVGGGYFFGETGEKGEKFVLGNGKDGQRIKHCLAAVEAKLNLLSDEEKEVAVKKSGFKLGWKANVVGFVTTLPKRARGWGERLYATKVIQKEIAVDVLPLPKPDKEGRGARVVRIGRNAYRIGKRSARFLGRVGKKTLGAVLMGPGFLWGKICEGFEAVKSFFKGLFTKNVEAPAPASA